MRIAAFVDSGGRPRDMSDKVAVILKELEGLKTQAVELGEEEVKVDGYTSGSLVALVRIFAGPDTMADVIPNFD